RTAPSRRRLPAVAGLLAILVLVLAGGFAWLAFGPGPAAKEGGQSTTVILKRGSNLPQIAETLADAGVIRLPFAFGVLAKASGGGGRLRAGEYAVPARASTWDILGMIRAGRIVHHFITIPEGLSSAEVADLLNAN